MGPVAGYSYEDFVKTGALPAATKPEKTRSSPAIAAKDLLKASNKSQTGKKPSRGFFASLFNKKNEEKMGPVAGYSYEDFVKTGTLPAATKPDQVQSRPKIAANNLPKSSNKNPSAEKKPKQGFFARLFSGKKKEKMGPIAGYSLDDFRKKPKQKNSPVTDRPVTDRPVTESPVTESTPASQLPRPNSGNSELRLPDMLTMPDDSQLRSSRGNNNPVKAPVIARPPAE